MGHLRQNRLWVPASVLGARFSTAEGDESTRRAIVAFSGEYEYGGAKVSEASLDGFPSNKITDQIQEDPYRFLICVDKFQTGYDESLLHTGSRSARTDR